MTGLVVAVVALAALVVVLWPRGSPRNRVDPPERISARSLRRLLEGDHHDIDGERGGGPPP